MRGEGNRRSNERFDHSRLAAIGARNWASFAATPLAEIGECGCCSKRWLGWLQGVNAAGRPVFRCFECAARVEASGSVVEIAVARRPPARSGQPTAAGKSKNFSNRGASR
jgi:hypothetical protein